AEPVLAGTGNALANTAGLAREAAAMHANEHVEPVAHFRNLQGREHGAAVLVLREVVVERAIVDDDLPGAIGEADARHRRLPPARAHRVLLGSCLRFRHGVTPNSEPRNTRI